SGRLGSAATSWSGSWFGARTGAAGARLAVVAARATWLLVIRRDVDDRGFAGDRTVALVDPDLDADDAVGGRGFAGAVVDVSAQGVQRHTAFAIPFGTCDLDAVQAAGRHELDTNGAQAHRVLHRALHGAAEHDT